MGEGGGGGGQCGKDISFWRVERNGEKMTERRKGGKEGREEEREKNNEEKYCKKIIYIQAADL